MAPGRLDLRRNLCPRVAHVGDHDIAALAGESDRRCPADASASAGDDRGA